MVSMEMVCFGWRRRLRLDLRSGRGHLAEESRALALLDRRGSGGRRGSVLLGPGLVSRGRVRLGVLGLRSSGRSGGRGGRASRGAARRSRGGSGTTALTRHFDGCERWEL